MDREEPNEKGTSTGSIEYDRNNGVIHVVELEYVRGRFEQQNRVGSSLRTLSSSECANKRAKWTTETNDGFRYEPMGIGMRFRSLINSEDYEVVRVYGDKENPLAYAVRRILSGKDYYKPRQSVEHAMEIGKIKLAQ